MAPSAMPAEAAQTAKEASSEVSIKSDVTAEIERLSSHIHKVTQHLFDNPELAFEEFIAHDTICSFFEEQGFTVKRKAYGVETAFEVLSGEGGRLVCINAEYDALPDVGHACGHHLIAGVGISAFLGIHFALKKHNIKGRVQLLGTPAEESGGGKISLLKAGAYKGVDAVLMSHPASAEMISSDVTFTGLGGTNFLAYDRWIIEYFGKPTHASACPWDGINAYDAAVAAHVNIGLLRQQLLPTERVHGCMMEGPRVANVIAPYTKLSYIARSPTKQSVEKLAKRVLGCFEAAAVATGCRVKISDDVGYDDVVNNKALCERYAQIGNSFEGQKVMVTSDAEGLGSSDFGNVSYAAPGLHSMFAIACPPGTGCHQHGFAAAAGTDDAFKRAMTVGSMIALLGVDLLVDDKLYSEVRKEWEASLTARGVAFSM